MIAPCKMYPSPWMCKFRRQKEQKPKGTKKGNKRQILPVHAWQGCSNSPGFVVQDSARHLSTIHPCLCVQLPSITSQKLLNVWIMETQWARSKRDWLERQNKHSILRPLGQWLHAPDLYPPTCRQGSVLGRGNWSPVTERSALSGASPWVAGVLYVPSP